MIGSNMKRVIALIAASAAAVSLAACGSNSSQDPKQSNSGTHTLRRTIAAHGRNTLPIVLLRDIT